MDLSKGVKKLTNRKRSVPVSKSRKEVVPSILPSNLATPEFGSDPSSKLQKEFSEISADDIFGISVTAKEKDIISSKSLKQRRELPEYEITDISYVMINNEELEKQAVFEVKNKDDSGLESINDPRGGVVDSHSSCYTCQKDSSECPGHVGIIKLNEPIIHPLVRKEVVYVLSSVCGSCGGLLLPKETIREKKILQLSGTARLKELAKASEKVPCRRNVSEKEEGVTPCVPNPVYKIDKDKIFYTHDVKGKKLNVMGVNEIYNILNSITPEDAKIMGFEENSHPNRFIMKALTVVPLCARAPIFQDGDIWQDDLTRMYQDIVRNNNELDPKLKLKEADRQKYIDSLIFSIEHMFNNADQKYRQLKKKPYKSILDRIQGKEGIVRGSLMGKRVNYSARTVIGPDPTLKFGQIRVPRVMAPYLTQHEIIDPNNQRKMQELLKNGKITHITPYAGRMAGRRFRVNEKHKQEYNLELGDEVDRWLSDGDYVVFNRQPTLHKQGIMGYEVVLGEGMTIGLHLGYTRQHNAD